ncbi:wax ester/triacylglycerol synthase family O-acyltransferase, partial [Streptomyces sp. SID11385]|uniref:wax ester/triacylglycerol synthase family O-acyltransferase n=1 Tax=Streptomyces sp. SID11385 TaxID=2706031 RepID=UPI0013C7243D
MPTSTSSVPAIRHPAHSVDRAFLRLERARPDVRWDSGGVAYLSGPPPTLAELRAYVGLCLPRLPLFASRAEGGARRAHWATDPEFTVERHVHEAVAEGPEQERQALGTALNAPFPAGARWGVWLVHGYAPDAYAVCYRFQHACQDGSAAALAFRTLLGDGEPSARPQPRPRTGAGLPPRAALALG